jgi:uncharacterized phage-associated protein
MYKAIDIAKKLLLTAKRDSVIEGQGELMSNMKLQKMLYYEQGFHLAVFGTPLFEEEIEAWMYGPVVPAVYEVYKDYGYNGIDPGKVEEISLSDREQALFDEVYKVYGAFSAIGLMNMTHRESPWANTPAGVGSVISRDKMVKFFRTRIND